MHYHSFGGSRFVPIISTITIHVRRYRNVLSSGRSGAERYLRSGRSGHRKRICRDTLIFGIVKRALIPFGLHHVFYLPFWQTAVGGSDGSCRTNWSREVRISSSPSWRIQPMLVHFSADATRYFSGEFIFMIFGLPGAALAMYRTVQSRKRKKRQADCLLSAALACMLNRYHRAIWSSPSCLWHRHLFAVQVVLAGSCLHGRAYAEYRSRTDILRWIFGSSVLFGILQGNEKTSWMQGDSGGNYLLYFVLCDFYVPDQKI